MAVVNTPEPSATPRPAAGPTSAGERSLAPDLARGAVLLFIALANLAAYYFERTVNIGQRPVDGSALDNGLDLVVNLLVDQRSYPMFAILFGYGMAKVVRRQLAAGRPLQAAQRLLVRRQLWLLLFGFVHAVALFNGDVLGVYAVTGLLTLALLGVRSVRALGVVIGVTLLPLAGFFSLVGLAQTSEAGAFGDSPVYLLSVGERLLQWVFAVVFTGVTFSLVGLFLIGVLLERWGWIDRPWDHRPTLRRVVVAGIALGVLGGLPNALQTGDVIAAGTVSTVTSSLLSAVHALTGVAAGLAYVCLAALAAAALRGRRPPAPLRALAATGERSLTAYLLQSVVLAPVLSPWGLGLGDTISTTQAYLLAVGVWLLSVLLMSLLARAGRRGPAETLLRRLQYGPPRPPSIGVSRGAAGG